MRYIYFASRILLVVAMHGQLQAGMTMLSVLTHVVCGPSASYPASGPPQ